MGGALDGDVARRLLARAVEVLVVAVERDGEQCAVLPLESDAGAGVVPHRGRAAPADDQDHLLVELPVRGQALARRNFHDVAVVRGARGFMVEEDRVAAAARPRLQLDPAQVSHIMRRDDVETLALHPTRVRRFLLDLEFVGRFVGNESALGHLALLMKVFLYA